MALTGAMGINRLSLYATFGDKQTLFLLCVDRYSDTVGQKTFAPLIETPKIQGAISGFFKAVVETVSGENTPSGCLIACVLTECATEMPEARELLATAISNSDQTIEQRLLQAIQDGQLPEAFPVRSRARLVTSLMHGIALRARAAEKKSLLLQFARDAARFVLEYTD